VEREEESVWGRIVGLGGGVESGSYASPIPFSSTTARKDTLSLSDKLEVIEERLFILARFWFVRKGAVLGLRETPASLHTPGWAVLLGHAAAASAIPSPSTTPQPVRLSLAGKWEIVE
jgi:hypothetical protein